jgi:NAD dependent epimerase/dehydratase family enzyme
MVKVAIAGGTGVIGKTLVDVLTGQSIHKGIVLTRKVLLHKTWVPRIDTNLSASHRILILRHLSHMLWLIITMSRI